MWTLVDSNVLLDVFERDPTWGRWSADAVGRCRDEGELCINPIIYAEVAVGFETIEQVEEALPQDDYRRLALPWEAAFMAGKVFVRYRPRGGARTCALPDFFIGAHAAVSQLRLLTRDPKRYRTYFPTVELIAPS